MQITLTGAVLVIAGVYSFFLNKDTLYKMTIFFLPFSATAIINFGEPGAGSSIQPYMLFAAIWILRTQLDHLKKKTQKKDKAFFIVNVLVVLFAIIAFSSIFMPVIIDGKEVGNVYGKFNDFSKITFSSLNITQLIYLYLGLLFTYYISVVNREKSRYDETIDIIKKSVLFVCIWGWIEFLLASLGVGFPYFIFNNSFHPAAGGYLSYLGEFKRISSVSVEPSVLSQVLVLPIPLLIYQFGLRKSWSLILFIVITLVFMRSSTGYVGLFVILALPFIKQKLNKKNLIRLGLVTSAFLLSLPLVWRLVISKVVSKIYSWSYLERVSSVLSAWENFINYPILGVGWGSVTSYDMFVKLLSNTGFLGFMSFLSILVFILFRLKSNNDDRSKALFIVMGTLIVMNEVGGWNFVFGHFWLYLGLGISAVGRKSYSILDKSYLILPNTVFQHRKA